MSDKSKLGFNINPKNYDELNSTDNLITSGSDSGWLGKKLQGGDSNDLDLSKINPLFDKELYEKYRPGVNTNDGSVNQDIWGYKCFNSPVSFRNGIYGDTYSINSIEGIDDNIILKSTYNGVSTAVNDKSHVADKNARDNVRYSYNLTNELLTAQEKSYIASTYTGKLRRALNSAVRPTYDLFEKEPRVYGSSIENETSVSGDIRSDCFWLYTYCNPDNTKLNIYNGINAYSSSAPTQYINERNEINIASTIFNDDNTETTQDTEHAYSESRVTVGANCKEDIVIKDYTSASGNCIRMYSTNGRYHNAEYINYNISSIVITSPESSSEDFPSIDMHVAGVDGGESNIIINDHSIELKSTLGIADPYINIDSDNNTITLHAATLNLPSVTVSNALFADMAGIASDAQAITYLNSDTLAKTKLLTVDSENVILPTGNKEISIGNNDHRLGTIYADSFNGKATSADTAGKAIHDYYGNDINATYVSKLNNTKNDIQSHNAIIGSGERLFFFNEPCIENSIETPENIPKSYISIGASYEDNGVTSKNVFSWTNKDNSVTRKCTISSRYDYDADKSTAYFGVYPEKAHSSDIADIGMAGATWSNIWCKRLFCDEVHCSQFPTIVGSTGGTSVGNIRLLCIKAPTASQTLTRTIEPGEEFEYPVTLSDNRPVNPYSIKCTIHIAKFKVADNSNNSIGIDPGEQVAGKWVALSSTYINANSANISLCFPVLAMRVE